MAPPGVDVLDPSVPKDVLAFCSDKGLTPYLLISLRLAQECFSPIRRLQVELELDPDTDEPRVIVEVGVDLPVDEVLRQNAAYSRQWVAKAPLDVGQKIRLLYNIL